MYVLGISADVPYLLTLSGWARARNRIFREVHTKIGTHWHKHMLPRHFQPGAMERYGYQERKEEYLESKARKWHKTPEYVREYPLAFSGDMRREMKAAFVIRSFPTRFSVHMRAPHYIAMRPKKAGIPNLGKEVTAITLDEINELETVGRKELERLFEQELRKKAKWLFK